MRRFLEILAEYTARYNQVYTLSQARITAQSAYDDAVAALGYPYKPSVKVQVKFLLVTIQWHLIMSNA